MKERESLYETKWNKVCVWEREDIDFPPHLHAYAELIVLREGSCVATVDLVDYPLAAGDALIVFPNRIHSYRTPPEIREKNYTLILPLSFFPPYQERFASSLPSSPLVRGFYREPEVAELLDAAYSCNRGEGPFDRAVAVGYLTVLLGRLLGKLDLRPAEEACSVEGRIAAYLCEHFREPLSLAVLEKDLWLSRFRLSHLFSARFGMSFPAFLRALRVQEAERLLSEGANVTEAAFSAGFGSLRSFDRAFFEQKHVTPSAYLRALREERER